MQTQWEKTIIETLKDARKVLALCDQGRAGKVNAAEDGFVRDLCEQIGYGAVMDSAQRMWEVKDSKGCFTVGPCLFTVREMISRIDNLLMVFGEDVHPKQDQPQKPSASQPATATVGRCRKCADCADSDHHWTNDPITGELICKHCCIEFEGSEG